MRSEAKASDEPTQIDAAVAEPRSIPTAQELTAASLAGQLSALIAGRTLSDVPQPTREQWLEAGMSHDDWITTGEIIRRHWIAQQRVDLRARKFATQRAKEGAMVAAYDRGQAASAGVTQDTDSSKSEF